MNQAERISELLQAENEETRLEGLHLLAGHDPCQHLSSVFSAMGDKSWRVRKEAVNLFLSLAHCERFVPEIIELLHAEENAGLRNAAAETLIRLGPLALPELLEEAACSDHDVRKFVIDILGQIGDERAIPLLLERLAEDPEENVRAAAAENLGQMQAVSAVPDLLNALRLPGLLQRFSLLEALAQIGQFIPASSFSFLSDDPLLRKPLYDCLGRISDAEALPGLLNGLIDPSRPVREAAVEGICRLLARYPDLRSELADLLQNPEILERIYPFLASSAISVRRSALLLLGLPGRSDVAFRLLDYLDDEQFGDEVARTLIRAGHAAVCPLQKKWSDLSRRSRIYLAYIFGESGCKESESILLAALDEADEDLVVASLHALGRLASISSLDAVMNRLHDDREEVREAAISALAGIGVLYRQQTLDRLLPLITSDSQLTRCSAVQTLARLGGPEVESALLLAIKDESPQVRRSAICALNGALPGHLPALLLALTDEESDVRRQAAEALGMSRDPSLLPELELVLSDDDPWVRTAVVRSLGSILPESRPALLRALQDPVGLVTISALEALAGDNSLLPVEELAACLSHPDDEVVLAALRSLQKPSTGWSVTKHLELLDHRHWNVRITAAARIAEEMPGEGRAVLEKRLLIEGEELVRQHLVELIAQTAAKGRC